MTSNDLTTTEVIEKIPNSSPRSYLVADCGEAYTTVALFDKAADSYRLVSRAITQTTAADPWDDIHKGVREAIEQISTNTGRILLNKRGDLIRPSRINGRGVDAFAAVVSAAPPLKTILTGLFEQVSLTSARRVLKTTYAHELDAFSLADTRSEGEQVTSIIQQQPDVIFIVGGINEGAKENLLTLIETIQISTHALSETKAPHILFAGNKDVRERVRAILGERVHLHVANNVRPTLDSENLGDASRLINELYEDIKIKTLPGIQEIAKWSTLPIQPTAQALATTTSYFAALQKGRVLAVDIGSRSVTLVEARPEEETRLWIDNALGIGQPIVNLLDRVQLDEVIRWLPSPVEAKKVKDFIHNKSIYPNTIPFTDLDLQLEQALARAILQCVVNETTANWYGKGARPKPLRQLLVRGNLLTASPIPSQTMLMLLDALQPTGIFSVVADKFGVLPALGVLAAQEPLAAVQAMEGGVLENLGWAVVPTGKGQLGQKVLNIVLESEQTQRLEVEVEYGTIEVLPLAPGQSAKVSLQPTRRFDIGFGSGKGQHVTVHGGTVGLVIDARGRPLNLPSDETDRQALLRQWHWDIGG